MLGITVRSRLIGGYYRLLMSYSARSYVMHYTKGMTTCLSYSEFRTLEQMNSNRDAHILDFRQNVSVVAAQFSTCSPERGIGVYSRRLLSSQNAGTTRLSLSWNSRTWRLKRDNSPLLWTDIAAVFTHRYPSSSVRACHGRPTTHFHWLSTNMKHLVTQQRYTEDCSYDCEYVKRPLRIQLTYLLNIKQNASSYFDLE